MYGKIIGVGFQKTGTSSLREALEILGYRVKDTSSRALIPVLRGDYRKVLRMIREYDAVEDTPWYMIYRELDRLLPGSKFILTIRDEEAWYNSVSRHTGLLRNASHEWIYGRGRGLPIHHKENAIEVYREHNLEVMDYFRQRPEDLLVVDFTAGEGWDNLCDFLGKEVPGIPFPHRNRWDSGKTGVPFYGYRKDFQFYRKNVRNYLKIKYIDLLGLWDRTPANSKFS